MIKEKAKKEKPGIYKCSGLSLLAILIILALLFHATWKVIALLLIILAACTVLPRSYRKWFWLSVAAVVVVLIIWVFLPDDNEGWRPYTFDEELAALEAKYAIPDSENAAIIYNQLLQDYNDAEFYGNLSKEAQRKLPIREPWLTKDHPELADWIKSHESTITRLKEAVTIKKCHFYIAQPVDEQRMRKTGMVRQWAFLLITAANNDLAQGHTYEALEKLITTLEMGKHHSEQPLVTDMLMGIAIEAFAVGHLKSFIVDRDATEQRLDAIEQAIADIKLDWSSDWLRVLEGEKLIAKNRFGEYYERDMTGRIRLSRDPKASIRKSVRDVLEKFPMGPKPFFPILWPNPNYWQRKLIKAKTILYWFYLPSNPQKGAEVIDSLYKKYYKMADADFNWKKEPEEISPGFMLSFSCVIEHLVDSPIVSYYRFHDIYLRCTADNNISRLIVALRRYKNKDGRWPETLDVIKDLVPTEILVDPINRGSFVYKLNEDNFTIYSKGKNNIDDGGERDKQSGADDWLIWPTSSRKTKNEKADPQQSNKQKDEAK
jgi:hypothetical protein